MYLLTYAPNEDSNQPAHPRSLIRIFAVHKKKLHHWVSKILPVKSLIRLLESCTQADPNLRDAHVGWLIFCDVSLVSLRCPHEETVNPLLYKMRPVKLLIRPRMCRLIWILAGAHVWRYVLWRCGSNVFIDLLTACLIALLTDFLACQTASCLSLRDGSGSARTRTGLT